MQLSEKKLPFYAILTASVMGFMGVALGAFGAHGLKETLEARGSVGTWETAVLYLFVHALAALGAGCAAMHTPKQRPLKVAVGCWLFGTIFFSGSLFWLALGGPKWLGPITPIGGTAFLAGWAFLATAAWQLRKN